MKLKQLNDERKIELILGDINYMIRNAKCKGENVIDVSETLTEDDMEDEYLCSTLACILEDDGHECRYTQDHIIETFDNGFDGPVEVEYTTHDFFLTIGN